MNPTDPRLGLPSASDPAFGKCPGKRQLIATIPPAKDEDADDEAKRGTRIHLAFQTDNPLELDEEEFTDYNKGVVFTDKLVNHWQADNSLANVKEGPRELRIWFSDPNTLEPKWSGQLDRHYLSGEHALIIDLKSGWSTHVPATPKSSQLQKQAVLLWKEHPQLTCIRVAFAKPKVWKGGTDDFCDYHVDDLRMAEQSIQIETWEAAQENAPRRAGTWCRYCPAKSFCVEAGAYTMLPAVIATNAQSPTTALTPIQIESMVAQMQPADLFRIVEGSTVIGKIIEAVKARAKTLPSETLAEFGWMLPEQGRKMDVIGNVAMAFRHLTQHFSVESVLDCMNFSKAGLVELARKDKGLSKADAEKWLDKELDQFISRGFADPSLKRIK